MVTKPSVKMFVLPSILGVSCLRVDTLHHEFSRHIHDSLVVGLVTQGWRTMTFDGGTPALAKAGDIFIIAPGQSHTCQCGPKHGYQTLNFHPSALTTFTDLNPICLESGVYTAPDVARIFTEIFDLQRAQTPQDTLLPKLGHLLLTLNLHHGTKTAPHTPSTSRHVSLALQHIQTHLSEKITLQHLAKAAYMSGYQLHRAVVNETGLSPLDHQTRLRTKKALDLMRQGLPLAEVAVTCGFSDQSHFSRVFKKSMGQTPATFLRDNLQH